MMIIISHIFFISRLSNYKYKNLSNNLNYPINSLMIAFNTAKIKINPNINENKLKIIFLVLFKILFI